MEKSHLKTKQGKSIPRPAKPSRLPLRSGNQEIAYHYGYASSEKAAAKSFSSAKLIQSLKAGLPVRELDDLRKNLGLPMDRLATMLGISKATLHRRKLAGRLDPTESDRVVRFARLLGLAIRVLESLENARQWLSSPQVGLGGAIPLDYASTEVGAREVEDLLGRIEYGIYS